MPLPLTFFLLAVIVLTVAARLALPALPLRRWARPMRPVDTVLAVVGMIGLVGHCTAMFFPSVVEAIPGTGPYLSGVNALGTVSVVLYVVPAVLVLIGLRRQLPVWLVVLALSLLVVGITMYDGGPLKVHLAAITVAVVLLALTTALLVRPTTRRAPATAH